MIESICSKFSGILNRQCLALIVKEAFPQVESILFPTIIAATVFYEIAGPIFTRYALITSKEAQ